MAKEIATKKKAGTKVAKEGGKQLTTTTTVRSSRIAKHTRKLEKLKATGLKPKSVAYGVRVVVQNAPVELAGVIMEMTEASIAVHHNKAKSSKEVVSHIPRSKLIEFTGDVGVPSLIRYFGDLTLTEIKSASVVTDGSEFVITDLTTGDVTRVFQSNNVRVELSGAAEAAAGSSSAPKKKSFKK